MKLLRISTAAVLILCGGTFLIGGTLLVITAAPVAAKENVGLAAYLPFVGMSILFASIPTVLAWWLLRRQRPQSTIGIVALVAFTALALMSASSWWSIMYTKTVEIRLFIAAASGDIGLTNSLLENGANPNTADSTGTTVLMVAATKGHAEIARQLIDRGAHVEAKDNIGFSPLIFAALAGSTETVRYLLGRGADPNAKTTSGHTALYAARKKGHRDIIALLRQAGARD